MGLRLRQGRDHGRQLCRAASARACC
jgi:hypothetical protein